MDTPALPGAAPARRVAAALARRVAALARSAVDVVVPPVCLGCRRPLTEPRTLCPSCWSQLELVTPPVCPVTGAPLAWDAGPQARSREAVWSPPLYDMARAAAVFGPVSRRLVHELKYRDVPGVAALMARLMAPAVREAAEEADVIVPMPLHPRRLFARRFNQAALITTHLAPLLRLPVEVDLVRRVRHTRPQVGLSRKERAENLADAFCVPDPFRVADRVVLVVDDVLTTGATADAVALALKAAGARAVHVAVFARVVPDDRSPA